MISATQSLTLVGIVFSAVAVVSTLSSADRRDVAPTLQAAQARLRAPQGLAAARQDEATPQWSGKTTIVYQDGVCVVGEPGAAPWACATFDEIRTVVRERQR